MSTVTAMVESPKGYGQKFDYDPKAKSFRLSKILPAGLVFPFDFGMIPGTRGDDGDPIDIIIIDERGSFPGCLIEVRLIGALQAEQTERDGKAMRNDRLVGIPVVSQMFPDVEEMALLPESIVNQLEHFFKNYNEQAGKRFNVTGRLDAAGAVKLLNK